MRGVSSRGMSRIATEGASIPSKPSNNPSNTNSATRIEGSKLRWLSAFRSRLQWVIEQSASSSSTQNEQSSHLPWPIIDIQSLTESPWKFREVLLYKLFEKPLVLRDYHWKLAELWETRQEQVSQLRTKMLTKPRPNSGDEKLSSYQQDLRRERQETEADYRVQFMTIIADGLTSLRWPPALEPFANVVPSLRDEVSVFHDAVDFILTTAWNSPSEIKMPSQDTKPITSTPQNEIPTREKPQTPRSTIQSPPLPKQSPIKFDTKMNNNEMSSPPPPPIIDNFDNTFEISNLDDGSITSTFRSLPSNITQRHIAPSNTVQQTIDLLTQQNSQLVAQLQLLRQAARTKAQVESDFSNLLRGVLAAVQEISSLASATSSVATQPTAVNISDTSGPPSWKSMENKLLKLQRVWTDVCKKSAEAMRPDTRQMRDVNGDEGGHNRTSISSRSSLRSRPVSNLSTRSQTRALGRHLLGLAQPLHEASPRPMWDNGSSNSGIDGLESSDVAEVASIITPSQARVLQRDLVMWSQQMQRTLDGCNIPDNVDADEFHVLRMQSEMLAMRLSSACPNLSHVYLNELPVKIPAFTELVDKALEYNSKPIKNSMSPPQRRKMTEEYSSSSNIGDQALNEISAITRALVYLRTHTSVPSEPRQPPPTTQRRPKKTTHAIPISRLANPSR